VRTVLVLLPVGLNVRNLAYTGVLDEIASGDDVRVVALSRVPDLPQRYETRSASVLFDAFPPRKPRTLTALLHAMLRRRFYGINGTRSTEILARGPLSSLRHQSLIDTVLGQPLPRSRMIYATLRSLERVLRGRASADVREVFARHRPSLVVSTNPTTLQEYDIVSYAKRIGVPTLGIIKSWDVLTMKGYIPLPLDHYIVWNDLMKQALMRLHGVAEDRIAVTGIPQFDIYSDRASIPTRADFFSALNLEPGRQTVLYATSSPVINPEDPEILRRLVPALVEAHGGSVQVIARLHEQDNTARYGGFEHPNLTYQLSEGHATKKGEHEFSDPALLGSLRDTLFHCDVVINTASTTSLDALAMGRPVVNIGFDLEPTEYHASRRRYYDFDHYRPIVESGTVSIAWTFEEGVSMILDALGSPPMDAARVGKLLDKMCWRLDGASAERMAASVLRVSSGVSVAEPNAVGPSVTPALR
jgi:hypothetical protein